MPRFNLSKLRGKFSTESRQARLESRYSKQLEKEKRKYEKYAAHKAEYERIGKLKSEVASYRTMRGKGKKRTVRIGGYAFKI
jgi:hypothetical protein